MKPNAGTTMPGKGVTVAIMDGAMLQSAAEDAIKANGDNETNAANDFMEKVISMGGPAAELIRWGEDVHGFHLCLDYIRSKNYRGEHPEPTVGRKVEAPARNNGGGHNQAVTHTSSAATVTHHGSKNMDTKTVAVFAKLSKSLYSTFKTSDGKAWGDIGYHELSGYERDGDSARIFGDAIRKKFANPGTSAIKELLSEEEFAACVKKIEKKGVK